ncbi:MAG TPA: hypothetical protein VJ761_05390 [Ktedonobacteraceae bacterium]|nr:hypothetical protein [Ktedonobacteraceae bacterium]
MAHHGSLRVLRLGVIGLFIAVLALVILPLSVSAQSLPSAHSSVNPDKTPMVKIESEHHNFQFKPQKVKVRSGGNITFKNDTHQDQVVTLNNAPLYTVLSHSTMTFPVTLSRGKYLLNLESNPNANLILIVK